MPYIYFMKEQDYHVTVDFHEIKCWIQRHNMIPVLVKKNGKSYPDIVSEKELKEGSEKTSLVDFLNTMLKRELAFKYNDHSYELVNQDDYIDEIQDL
ncbi:MAG: hypothetical protein RLY57_13 [Candidatus Parcubacteria bacterium]